MGWRWPLSGFFIIVGLGALARLGVGGLGADPIDLLGDLSQSAGTLTSASMLASATTLALMLTLIGLIKESDRFGAQTYKRIGIIAKLSTGALLSCAVLLLVQMLPIREIQGVNQQYYTWIYEGIFAWTVIAVALLVATVLMLFHTIMTIVNEFRDAIRSE